MVALGDGALASMAALSTVRVPTSGTAMGPESSSSLTG